MTTFVLSVTSDQKYMEEYFMNLVTFKNKLLYTFGKLLHTYR